MTQDRKYKIPWSNLGKNVAIMPSEQTCQVSTSNIPYLQLGPVQGKASHYADDGIHGPLEHPFLYAIDMHVNIS